MSCEGESGSADVHEFGLSEVRDDLLRVCWVEREHKSGGKILGPAQLPLAELHLCHLTAALITAALRD